MTKHQIPNIIRQDIALSRRLSRLSGSILMVVALALSSPMESFAQSTGTGTISGRVINASTGT